MLHERPSAPPAAVAWFAAALFLAMRVPASAGEFAAADPARPPNVVLIVIDDLGWSDLGCYGNALYDTPRLDQLAVEGMRFTDAYANCPVCSPSRAALMTGQYPARVGFTGHITATGQHRYPADGRIIPPDDHLDLPHETITLAEALHAAGYVSASIGKWHLGDKPYWPETHGFDLNVAGYTHGSPPSYFFPYESPDKSWNPGIPTLHGGEPGEYLTDRLTDEAIHFVEANRERPFLLYLPHYAVHTPLEAPERLVEKYKMRFLNAAPHANAVYAAMVESVDSNVGRLLSAIDEAGLTAETLVIVTSDNGGLSSVTENRPLREGKGWLYEGGIRVPLLVKWPGRVAPGSLCTLPVHGADLYPTIVDAVGPRSQPGEPLDGVSLMPVLTESGKLDREAITWYYPHYSPQAKHPGAAIRAGEYKLIEHYDPPGIELYDLTDDLGEERNLAARMPEKAATLRAALNNHLHEMGTLFHTPNPGYVPR